MLVKSLSKFSLSDYCIKDYLTYELHFLPCRGDLFNDIFLREQCIFGHTIRTDKSFICSFCTLSRTRIFMLYFCLYQHPVYFCSGEYMLEQIQAPKFELNLTFTLNLSRLALSMGRKDNQKYEFPEISAQWLLRPFAPEVQQLIFC